MLCRFELFKSSICIVNTHLAAHQRNFNARNRDYHNILRRAILLPPQSASGGRRKKIYTDTSNKLKLQPWNANPTEEEDEEEEEEAEEEDLATTVNPTATNTAALPSTGSQPTAAASKAAAPSAGKGLDISNMKRMMSAGLSQLKKGIATTIATVSSELEQMQAPTEEMIKEGFRIYEADHVFWIGDLNYRLAVKSMDEVHALINKSHHITQTQLHASLASC